MIGALLGSYLVTRELGRGGMGVVYLAEHAVIGRRAAIKVLRPQFSDRTSVMQRFVNEARTAASVQHPGIVEMYDFGHAENGSAYIVMEYLQGESLKDRIQRVGPMPEDQALVVARQIADVLGAAHACGIVHRDLKPANLFISASLPPTQRERVRLLDFGIAKIVSAHNDNPLTHTDVILGTPAYMAPEQCRGAKHVDHKADLYALGCIMYCMLCGQPPFHGNAATVMGAHIHEAPPRLSSLAPWLSNELERIVMRLLAKARDERFPDANAVIEVLDAYVTRAGGAASAAGPDQTAAAVAAHPPVHIETPASTPVTSADLATSNTISALNTGNALPSVLPTGSQGQSACSDWPTKDITQSGPLVRSQGRPQGRRVSSDWSTAYMRPRSPRPSTAQAQPVAAAPPAAETQPQPPAPSAAQARTAAAVSPLADTQPQRPAPVAAQTHTATAVSPPADTQPQRPAPVAAQTHTATAVSPPADTQPRATTPSAAQTHTATAVSPPADTQPRATTPSATQADTLAASPPPADTLSQATVPVAAQADTLAVSPPAADTLSQATVPVAAQSCPAALPPLPTSVSATLPEVRPGPRSLRPLAFIVFGIVMALVGSATAALLLAPNDQTSSSPPPGQAENQPDNGPRNQPEQVRQPARARPGDVPAPTQQTTARAPVVDPGYNRAVTETSSPVNTAPSVLSAEEITITIQSEPSGAAVFRELGDVRLGSTPYRQQMHSVQGELVLIIRHEGYEHKSLAVPADRSGTYTVLLVPRRSPRPQRNNRRSSQRRQQQEVAPTTKTPRDQGAKNAVDVLDPFQK